MYKENNGTAMGEKKEIYRILEKTIRYENAEGSFLVYKLEKSQNGVTVRGTISASGVYYTVFPDKQFRLQIPTSSRANPYSIFSTLKICSSEISACYCLMIS
jgi:hypothetical protein